MEADARRPIVGGPKGNKHVLKHGRYTAEAIAERREIRELIRAMRALACQEHV
jgi:putative heme iron utilization protein